MRGREALRKALNHREGRLPVDFGSTTVTGIHCSIIEKLRAYLGLEKRTVVIDEPYQMLGRIDADLREALGLDVVGIPSLYDMFGIKHGGEHQEWRTPWGQDVLMPKGFAYEHKDGNTYVFPRGNREAPPSAMMPQSGYFFDAIIRQGELGEEDMDPTDNLEEYQLLGDDTTAHFKAQMEMLAPSECGIVASPGGTGIGDIALVPGMSLEFPRGIRDIEEWYVSTIVREGYLHDVFARQTDIALENLQKVYDTVGDGVDVVMICGTDFGTQKSTFCSLETFQDLYQPYYRKMNDWIHAHTPWKIFKHSCGAIESFIGPLIDSGFDIINPVQWTAEGMDRHTLKQKYGSNVTFWGGGVDTQSVLPFGTADEVYNQVLACIDIFAKDGGYVFNSIHNVQARTPVENVVAMFNAVKKYNGDIKI